MVGQTSLKSFVRRRGAKCARCAMLLLPLFRTADAVVVGRFYGGHFAPSSMALSRRENATGAVSIGVICPRTKGVDANPKRTNKIRICVMVVMVEIEIDITNVDSAVLGTRRAASVGCRSCPWGVMMIAASSSSSPEEERKKMSWAHVVGPT
jgi:hypothetical protein